MVFHTSIFSIFFLLGSSCLLVGRFVVVPPTAFGEASGSIKVEVFGQVGPLQFSWTSGETQQNLTSLGAGMYSVNISDSICEIVLGPIVLAHPGDANADCKVIFSLLCE